MATITLNSITKTYGTETAVDSLDLTIGDGEVLGVVGPSGCGKTTTLRTIAGFETPTDGSVRFDGEDVTHVPPENRNVGLVFQSYALFDNMSVRANVAFGLKMQGVSKQERTQRAEELLSMLGMRDLADRSPENLSGGQQQRVGLARALAIEPNVLLLDEPMTGLDAKLKDRLQREIRSLLTDLGTTVLYVTHDQEEAMTMCDRIAVMNGGTIEQVGTPADIYEQPETPFIADFVGTSNLFSGQLASGKLNLGFTTLELSYLGNTSAEVTICVRPDDFGIGNGSIQATVEEVTYLGSISRITASLPDDETVILESDSIDPDIGSKLSVDLDGEDVHVIEKIGESKQEKAKIPQQ